MGYLYRILLMEQWHIWKTFFTEWLNPVVFKSSCIIRARIPGVWKRPQSKQKSKELHKKYYISSETGSEIVKVIFVSEFPHSWWPTLILYPRRRERKIGLWKNFWTPRTYRGKWNACQKSWSLLEAVESQGYSVLTLMTHFFAGRKLLLETWHFFHVSKNWMASSTTLHVSTLSYFWFTLIVAYKLCSQ